MMTHPHGSNKINTSGLPKGSIGSLRHVWLYLKPYWLGVLGACFALIFTSSAVLGIGAALKYLINEGIAAGNLELLDAYYWRLLGVVIILAFATYSRYYLISWVGERVVADIRNAVYQKMARMHVGFFETTRTGELLSRITTDTTLLQNVVGSSVSIFLRNLLLFIGGTAMLILTSTHLTQFVVVLLPLVIAPIIILGRRVRQLSRATQQRVSDISAHAEETISAIRTIQSMALEDFESARFAEHVFKSRNTAVKRIRVRSLLTAIVICLVFGAIVTVLWIGGRDVVEGAMTPGDLSAFIFYAVVVAGAVGALSETIGELQRAAGATERLMELLALESEITAPETPTPLPKTVDGLICFNDVTFHYPSRPDTASLEQFSLMTEPGSTLALVGPSGAGKTTVFQLLQRFYDPQNGSITLDGINIRNLDPTALRSTMAIVPQDPVIFSANAWDNIRCGRPEATDEEVIEAAKQANALGFIKELPKEFDTYLGEKGVRLSGGQKQRIAIARAIVRNPRILLLDEATSALDSENEKLVQTALESAMKDRTTLVIAHRLSTVQKANKIVVIEHGKIHSVGSHEELLRSSDLYKRLANIQLSQTG